MVYKMLTLGLGLPSLAFAPFSPLQFFGLGDSGFLYNRPRLGRLFQDDAGTVPAAEDLDPVGLVLDDGPSGNDAIQSNSAARPNLEIGSPNDLYFTTDDYLDTGVAPAGWSEGTLIADFTPETGDAGPIGCYQTSPGFAGCYIWVTAGGLLAGALGSVSESTLVGGSDIRDTRVLAMLRWDDSTVQIYNGASLVASASFAGTLPTNSIYRGALHVGTGVNHHISAPFRFDMAIDRRLTDAEWTQLRSYLG